jgi:2-iminobutanoate/2-iminopropanoate deaminase
MTDRRYLHPAGWGATPGYTHAVVTAGRPLLFLSGQVALDAANQLVGRDDFAAQAEQVFQNLGTVLATAGATFADVVKLTYLVVGLDQSRLLALRAVRDRYLPADERPASSLLGVAALFREDVLIEIEAVAELPRGAQGGDAFR